MFSLSLTCLISFSLTYALYLGESVSNREAHSLFILVSNLTIAYQVRVHYESLITLVPLNSGDFSLRSTKRVNLNSIMGTISPTYNRGLNSMNLHDFIILMTLPIGTLGTNAIQYMKYTSEYIMKLQIHQHSLLTRKVYSLDTIH